MLFTDPTTQLACKSRLDLVYTSPKRQNALIFDFKTTSARTQAQFLQSCYDYDYDRQAAFYLDSLRYADGHEWATTKRFRFVFIGVMKQSLIASLPWMLLRCRASLIMVGKSTGSGLKSGRKPTVYRINRY